VIDTLEVAKILLRIKAVTLRVDPPFTWASGIKSPIYTDNRLLMSFPKERRCIVTYFLKLLKENGLEPDIIAGIATSGIPWASWIAQELNLPMVYIRSKPKGHGKENLIEGKIEKGQKVVIIEDLISTGGSSLNGAKAVKEAGAIVLANVAIFTYELPESVKNFAEAGVKLISLTKYSSLIEVALKEEYIEKEDKATLLDWKKDPKSWGK